MGNLLQKLWTNFRPMIFIVGSVFFGVLLALAVFVIAFINYNGFGIPKLLAGATSQAIYYDFPNDEPCGDRRNPCSVIGINDRKKEGPCGWYEHDPCYVSIVKKPLTGRTQLDLPAILLNPSN